MIRNVKRKQGCILAERIRLDFRNVLRNNQIGEQLMVHIEFGVMEQRIGLFVGKRNLEPSR